MCLQHPTNVRKTRLPERNNPDLNESQDITTVSEQGVQWDFADEEMRDQVCKKIIAERPFLLVGFAPVHELES